MAKKESVTAKLDAAETALRAAQAKLDAARAAPEATASQIAELVAQREAALLNDDDAGAGEMLAQIRQLELRAVGHQDKIRLLEAAADRAQREAIAERRSDHIRRVEKKIAKFMEVAGRFPVTIGQQDKDLDEAIGLIREIQTMTGFKPHDLAACLLTPGTLLEAITHEIYRISARPMLLGSQVEGPRAGISLPGGKCPRVEWQGVPDRIKPLADLLAAGARLASDILRRGISTANVTAADQLAPASAPAIIAPEPSAAPVTNGNAETQPRTPAQERLSALLAEMAAAAEDVSEAGERKYQEISERVVEAQDQVNRERGIIQ